MNNLNSLPTVTVIGSGYVGVTSAAIFANAGYKVYALEINPERLATIKKGKSFFYEAHLDPLLEKAVSTGMLIGTNSYEEAIPNSDIVFSCVGTPDNSDGSSNLKYVYAAATETAAYAKQTMIYVQKSTVPVGTGAKVEAVLQANGHIDYVSNPEFLREGTAILDSLWFDRIVVGGVNPAATNVVLDIYRQVALQRDKIAMSAGMESPKRAMSSPEYITVGLNSAELIKVSANAFLALKISFANSIAKLADAAGADVVEVMDAVGADPRIGRAFLNAGRGYGGGCFPKDVSGLISSGLEYGIDLNIMQAASAENHSMPGYILEKTLDGFEGNSLTGKKVALLGIAFKAGTSDVRKSPSIKMANLLVDKMDANVHVYDPQAFIEGDARAQLHNSITIAPDMEQAMREAEVVIVATDWPEFKDIAAETYVQLMKGITVVDAMNCLDSITLREAGLRYIGVGR
jgi:UDPglucose 6-dehydrogenase